MTLLLIINRCLDEIAVYNTHDRHGGGGRGGPHDGRGGGGGRGDGGLGGGGRGDNNILV